MSICRCKNDNFMMRTKKNPSKGILIFLKNICVCLPLPFYHLQQRLNKCSYMLYFVCGCGVLDQCVTAIRSFLKLTIDSRKTPKGTRSDDQCECGGVFSACVWFCGVDIAQASIIKSSVDIDETFGSGGGRSVALARNPYKSTVSL